MRSPADTSVDVAIVGAGPTGTILAILLAQQGHTVMLLDRQPAPYPLPRAVTFDHEIGRVLQGCGIGHELRGRIEPADKYEWRNADGLVLLLLGTDGDGPSGWPAASMFNQPMLEELLAERVAQLPGIQVRRGREVVSFSDRDTSGVELWHRDTAADDSVDDERVAVQARYLAGCDGANSMVRTALGIGFEDLGFFYDWLVVDVIPHVPQVWDPINLQVCDPLRPTTAVSGGKGRRRWEFMRLPDEDPAELSGADSAWRLLAPWGVDPTNATLERHANYTFRARWAQQWRKGSVFLAGDAAHQMPPFAGQGLCSGARDAANLAWKLDLVLRGHAADELLDTYETERVPHVQAVINFSMELGKIICIPDPAEAAARDEFMSAMAASGERSEVPLLSGITGGVLDAGCPDAGNLFIQGIVGDGAPQYLDEVVGAGMRLVTSVTAADHVAADLLAWFEGIGGAVVTVAPGDRVHDGQVHDGQVNDTLGHYSRWFAKHGVVAALQRPDFYVYGTATAPTDIGGLLARLRTALHATA